jgi:hypothetical protein
MDHSPPRIDTGHAYGALVTQWEISAVIGEEVKGYAGGKGLSILHRVGNLKFSSRQAFGSVA